MRKNAYVIQSGGFYMENRYVTLNEEVAKKLIKEEILDNAEDNIPNEKIEKFAQDLVDGNINGHYSDEFASAGVYVWCDIVTLIE